VAIQSHSNEVLYVKSSICADAKTGGTRSLDKELDFSVEPAKKSSPPYLSIRARDTISKYENFSAGAAIEEVPSAAHTPLQGLPFHIQGTLMHPHQNDEFYANFPYFSERISRVSP
jgi:hypothetical protein